MSFTIPSSLQSSFRTNSDFKIPYVGPISGGLREDMALYLQGVVPTNADKFRVNFKTGPTDNHDIAFHFASRMGSNVGMNSSRNGEWEGEESVSDNPFKKGQAFEMFIVIKSEGYQVYVNGKEQYTFKHRIPLEKVSTLNINGDLAVNHFGFIQNWSTSFVTKVKSSITSLRGKCFTVQAEILQPVQNPILPYVGPISGGLRVDMALYLQGVVPTNADEFRVNFKTGPADEHDIAFHFASRMGLNVGMNSSRNGEWEGEESVSDNPFKKGQAFEMFIVIKSEGYQVYVNGKELYMFKHRIPLEKVSALNIIGDVAVKLFGFIQNWSTSFFTKYKSTITSLDGERFTVQAEILHPVQNPKNPNVGPIPGGLREGMALYLQGFVPFNVDEFQIYFMTLPNQWYNVGFAFKDPFKKGQAFEMFIVIKSEGYQVYVNGKELYTVTLGIPVGKKVSALKIIGEVSLNLFGFIQNWSTSLSTIQ